MLDCEIKLGFKCPDVDSILLHQNGSHLQLGPLTCQAAELVHSPRSQLHSNNNINLQLLQRGVTARPLPKRLLVIALQAAPCECQAAQLGGFRQHRCAACQHIQAGSQRPQARFPWAGRQGCSWCLGICGCSGKTCQAAALQVAQPRQGRRGLAAVRFIVNAEGGELQE